MTMDTNEPTDADLVAQTLARDREAFGCLYDRYGRLVRAVVGGETMDWSSVQDLTQECFLRAYRGLPRLRDPDRFGAWMVGIARQVARERKRSLGRDRHKFVGDRPLEVESPADALAGGENEQLDLVMQQLALLPERERLAIHAFFLHGCDVRQTAELLSLSRSGVYALLQRAVARLANLLACSEAESEAK